ncbi:Glycosyl transferase, family 25 [uncultured Candidatus Thioglobus sp.]|nr:Glycosyl transferase, family 25 [uncultured Candidatus Thioglobus sp.]
MRFQEKQLKKLGIKYEILEAITPEKIYPELESSYWLKWQRPMTDVEKSIMLSHCMAWHKVKENNTPYLILEDDALLSLELPEFLSKVEKLSNIDHISIEVRSRKKLMHKKYHAKLNIRRLYQDKTGAAAYILWPNGAKKLLDRSQKKSGLADAIICSTYNMISYQADPAFAIQLDQCRYYGIDGYKNTGSLNPPFKKTQFNLSVIKYLSFRFKRIYAQIRIGLRILLYISISDLKEPELKDINNVL